MIALIILFLIYWTIVCIYACIPQYPRFKEDDYNVSYCAGFGRVFLREEKTGIGIACLIGFVLFVLFRDQVFAIYFPIFRFFANMILMGAFLIALSFLTLFPIVFPIIFGLPWLFYLFLPAKIVQTIGLALVPVIKRFEKIFGIEAQEHF